MRSHTHYILQKSTYFRQTHTLPSDPQNTVDNGFQAHTNTHAHTHTDTCTHTHTHTHTLFTTHCLTCYTFKRSEWSETLTSLSLRGVWWWGWGGMVGVIGVCVGGGVV